MRNIKKWLHDYENLSTEQQVEVALAIAEFIKRGRSSINFREFEEERLDAMDEVLHVLSMMEDEKKFLSTTNILNNFRALPQKKRLEIANSTYRYIEGCYEETMRERNENICNMEGHTFGKWVRHTRSGSTDAVIDHQFAKNMPYEYTEWTRTCTFCGKVETTRIEPEEAKEERLEKERQDKIRKLKRELKELEGEEC